MKKKFLALALAAVMVIPVGLAACTPGGGGGGGGSKPSKPGEDAADWYKTYDNITENKTEYNKNLYYFNELKFKIADPTVIYVDHGEEEGYFYAYGTSDLVEGYGIQCWRSKDLTNWEYKSVAFHPDFDNTWAFKNHWAPEVLYDADLGKYLMFYNADWTEKDEYTDVWYLKGENAKTMTVVIADEPYGPFVPVNDDTAVKPVYDFSPRNSAIPKDLQRSNMIDAHPFIDPVSGDKYLYYSGYGYDGNKDEDHPYGYWRGQTLFGVKLTDGNWLDPDYSTLKELTHFGYTDTNDTEVIQEGQMSRETVNEGPFVWYQGGKYYLTFSVYAFTNPAYQVRQAIADDPLGDFVKVQPADGGTIIDTDLNWRNVMQSAGHHCFIPCGDQLMIAYHTFYDRATIQNHRALAVDTISWVKNDKGQTLMHANGPTYSYQPLPAEISGYKNVASKATVTANNTAAGSSVNYLTDGQIKVHNYNDPVKEFTTSGGKTEIKLSFDKFVNARSILIYNSVDYNKTVPTFSSIKVNYKVSETKTAEKEIKNVVFDYDWYTNNRNMVYSGANTIIEFDELPVNEITLTINGGADDVFALNEIMVLGKELSNSKPVSVLQSYKYTNPADVNAIPVYESLTFGSAGDGKFVSNYGFDLSHDDGTENAYVDKTWCGNQQHLYFKGVESLNFYVEVELSRLDHLKSYNNDPYPKAGIVMKTRAGQFISYNIDYMSAGSNPQVGFVQSNSTGSDYNWGNYKTFSVAGLKFSGNDYAKLGFARIGGKVWMFANGGYVATVDSLNFLNDNETTKSAIALVTFNCFTRYKNYKVTTDLKEVKQAIQDNGGSL